MVGWEGGKVGGRGTGQESPSDKYPEANLSFQQIFPPSPSTLSYEGFRQECLLLSEVTARLLCRSWATLRIPVNYEIF